MANNPAGAVLNFPATPDAVPRISIGRDKEGRPT
jgi:hypothetical protein